MLCLSFFQFYFNTVAYLLDIHPNSSTPNSSLGFFQQKLCIDDPLNSHNLIITNYFNIAVHLYIVLY